MDPLHRIAESKLAEAIEAGAFRDLPGLGEPLQFEDLSSVPPQLRMGYHVLKQAGYLPEELELRKACLTLQDLLDACEDPGEAARMKVELNAKRLRYQILMEKRRSGAGREYHDALMRRLR